MLGAGDTKVRIDAHRSPVIQVVKHPNAEDALLCKREGPAAEAGTWQDVAKRVERAVGMVCALATAAVQQRLDGLHCRV